MYKTLFVAVFNCIQTVVELIINDRSGRYVPIGDTQAIDVYGDIRNSIFFDHYSNCNNAMFDYVYGRMAERI